MRAMIVKTTKTVLCLRALLFCLVASLLLTACSRRDARHTAAAKVKTEPATQSYQPVIQDFGDWVLTCSNTRLCSVRSVNPNLGFVGYLGIMRDPGPLGAAQLDLAEPDHPEAANVRKFAIDGRQVTGHWHWKHGRSSDVVSLLRQEAVQGIAALAVGQVATFEVSGHRVVISLNGLKEALAAMDSVQGRAGTVSALLLTGNRPATAVPGPPAIPVLEAAPRPAPLADADVIAAQVRKVAASAGLLDKHECEADPAERMDEAYALDAENALVFIGCYLGMYQMSYLLWVAPRSDPQRAHLLVLPAGPIKPCEGEETLGEYVDLEWNPGTATVTSEARGRGIGDCGERKAWTYLGNSHWALSEHRMMQRCGDGLREWPEVYRAKVRTVSPQGRSALQGRPLLMSLFVPRS